MLGVRWKLCTALRSAPRSPATIPLRVVRTLRTCHRYFEAADTRGELHRNGNLGFITPNAFKYRLVESS